MGEMLKGTENEPLRGNTGETPSPVSGTAPGRAKQPRRVYSKSGLWSLKSAVRLLGGRAIDRRTAVGQALEAWRDDLSEDLGGVDSLSTQQKALIDLAVKSKLMLDSIDAWVLAQPTLMNARKRSMLPVVRERFTLAAQFTSLMKDLGLERRAKPALSLTDYIRGKALEPGPGMAAKAIHGSLSGPGATESTPPAGPEKEES